VDLEKAPRGWAIPQCVQEALKHEITLISDRRGDFSPALLIQGHAMVSAAIYSFILSPHSKYACISTSHTIRNKEFMQL